MPTWTRQLFEHNPLTIAKGGSNGHSGVHIFGDVPAMSQNDSGTVWDVSDTMYPWGSFTTASVLNIPAVSATDNGNTVEVFGLGVDYNPISEVVTLSSAASVSTTKEFLRFRQAYYSNGAFNVNAAAAINLRVGTTVVGRILQGNNQTLSSVYTVPAGYTAFLTKGTMSCQDGADASGFFYYRLFENTHFRIGHTFEVSSAQYVYEFTTPFLLPEKSDLDVRATVRSNNARITAAYDIILVNNNNIYR